MCLARPSVAMTSATFCRYISSNMAANAIAWGKTVAVPARATPCSASFHQLYSGMPSRSMAGALYVIWKTFSSRVIWATQFFRFGVGLLMRHLYHMSVSPPDEPVERQRIASRLSPVPVNMSVRLLLYHTATKNPYFSVTFSIFLYKPAYCMLFAA